MTITAHPPLSASLAAALAASVTRWSSTAYATGPADRAVAEAGVRSAYRAAGLAEPDRIVWFDSPAYAALAVAALTGGPAAKQLLDEARLGPAVAKALSAVGPDVGLPVREQVRTRPWERARTQAVALLGPTAWAEAWSLSGALLWPDVNRLTTNLRRAIATLPTTALTVPAAPGPLATGTLAAPALDHAALAVTPGVLVFPTATAVDTEEAATSGDQGGGIKGGKHGGLGSGEGAGEARAGHVGAGEESAGEAGALLRRVTLDAVLGQQDAAWLSLFDALGGLPAAGDVLEPPLLDMAPLDGLMSVSRAAGWWWPFERVALICERPAELHHDDLRRLHRAEGPALAFPDGFALHAWHGMPVPRDFGAQMAGLSAQRIRDEPNAELRRVMLEHYGFERYLAESDAKAAHKDATGVLWRIELPDDEALVMVEVVNSTPEPDGTSRTYFLRVPPWVTTAREGVAWTFGLSADDYQPKQET